MVQTQGNENTVMFAEERHRSVLERLNLTGKVTVEELTAAFGVSAATVRADLARLEEQGLLRRTHGGAIRANATLFEPPYAQRKVMRYSEKRAIARAAARLVKDGDTVLLDAGTTTYELALALQERNGLKVVTNSIANAMALMDSKGVEVILVGGSVQPQRQATLGPLAAEFLKSFRVDRAFMAFNGVHFEAGYTVVDFDAAAIKRRMMECAADVVVLADSSKIGQIAFASVAPLSGARLLVTDRELTDVEREQLEEHGLSVEVA